MVNRLALGTLVADTDYNPFDVATAPKLNQELRQVLERSRKAATEPSIAPHK
jgi:hypothetical protein